MTDNSTMRPVVVVTTSFPVAKDGSEAAGSFVFDLVEELSRTIPVRVVAPGPKSVRELLSDRIEVFRYAAPGHALSELKPFRISHWPWIFRVLQSGAASTMAAADGASGIVALWGLPSGEWARRAARARGMDYCVWLLGSDVWTLGKIPIVRHLLGRVIRNARCAFADGYQLAEDARRIAGTSVDFLPSTRELPVRDLASARNKPPYRLVFIGRWHVNKGVDILLSALESLSDEDWKKIDRVDIYGGGPMEPLVREKCERLRNHGRAINDGHFIDKDRAVAAIDDSDWLLIPSRIESIPVVFSDAMKRGRAVVSTPVGDLRALINDNNAGICAATADVDGFANALKRALNSDPTTFTAGVLKTAALFSLTSIAQRLLRDCSASA